MDRGQTGRHLPPRCTPPASRRQRFLANPLDEITAYYSDKGLAAPFERQAMIKLRHVAGDEALGKQIEAHRDRYVYSGRRGIGLRLDSRGSNSNNSSNAAR